ncbi:transcriptional regulator [plant metagenome]|uniref:Transcriptional regulator n=1 Tax=plant metagenome TaxID=1297885 RepID=A0A484Q5Q7_9ZZZZ
MAAGADVDFALSAAALQWEGWVCEPLWHDTLAVAVAKRSHLLAYREVPHQQVLQQPVICSQSTAGQPWRTTVQHVFENALQDRENTVDTFDVAMTLVAAGYGIAIAPTGRLTSYLCKGIALRALAGAPAIVVTYLLHRDAALSGAQARFAQRARLQS